MKKGFTLIELLVVVLIIGILSAIALPQYRLAVLKARYTQSIVLGDAIWKAQQIYYMANNKYATDLDELDISLPPGNSSTSTSVSYNWGSCSLVNGGYELDCPLSNLGSSLDYVRRMENNRRICRVYPERSQGDLATKLCLSLGGVANESGVFVNYDLP